MVKYRPWVCCDEETEKKYGPLYDRNYSSKEIDGFFNVFDLEIIWPEEWEKNPQICYNPIDVTRFFRDSNGNWEKVNKLLVEKFRGENSYIKCWYTLNGKMCPYEVTFLNKEVFNFVKDFVNSIIKKEDKDGNSS